MPSNIQTSFMARNVQLDALGDLANGGFLRVYAGAQPLSADTPINGQTLLCELRLGKIAFRRANAGAISAFTITDDNDARATGTASWYRLLRADGATALWDGSVGVEAKEKKDNPDLIFNSTRIQQHAKVSVKEFSHSIPK